MSVQQQHCRSCGAAIYWLVYEATDKRAPIEPAPEGRGNIAVDLEAGTYKMVVAGSGGYLNHFATCPQSVAWAGKK